MTVPVSFNSVTSNFSLPLLFSGQAQKEFFINEALALIDALLQFAVNSSIGDPPANPADGECYRVAGVGTGDWAGQEDKIAAYFAGGWHFVSPHDGMVIFDRTAGEMLRFKTAWVSVSPPATPQGGAVIDAEARQALADLTEALRNIGIFPPAT